MVKLIRPSLKYKNEILEFKRAFIDNSEHIIPGSELLDKKDDIEEWLEYVENNSKKESVSSDWVLTDTFMAFSKNKIVGIISLRHELNDFLKDYGHIGFSVIPSERKKGIATSMLGEVLKVAKNNNMTEVQLSTEEKNIASIKTIEKMNGKYIRSFYLENQKINEYLIFI